MRVGSLAAIVKELRTIFAFGNALELPVFCMIAFCKIPANILNIHISLEDNILFRECNL